MISKEELDEICKAGKSGPSGMAKYPIHFVVVQDKDMLVKLSKSRISFRFWLNRKSNS